MCDGTYETPQSREPIAKASPSQEASFEWYQDGWLTPNWHSGWTKDVEGRNGCEPKHGCTSHYHKIEDKK